MEVADRTAADRKGGHLARRTSDGRLVLRESAQCPDADMDAFQDIERHRYFNTNNLWINLRGAASNCWPRSDGVLGLPMIRNSKTLDPRDPLVAQSVSAGDGDGRGDLVVRRRGRAARAPVPGLRRSRRPTTCSASAPTPMCLTEDWRVVLNPARRYGVPVISLDPKYYKLIDQMEARFPYGPPSLLECERLTVKGDVRFGRGVVCRGAVEVVNEARPDELENTVLSGTVTSDH